MKHIHLLFVALLLSIGSAKAQVSPLQFNDNLASITDSLFARGQSWGRAFNDAYKSGNYYTLKPHSSAMLVFIEKQTSYVKNMKDVKESKPLRLAMLDLLAFEKRMITESFKPFEVFNSSTPKEKVAEAYENLKAQSANEDSYLKKLAAAQELYATQNGFKIEPAAGEETPTETKD